MKKKGLIIATIVMVLVLAVSLTTATYAWFTVSSVTTIKGFDVEVVSNQSVFIGVKETATYESSAASNTNAYLNGDVVYGGTDGELGGGTWTGGAPGLGYEITHNIQWGAQKKAVGATTADDAADATYGNTGLIGKGGDLIVAANGAAYNSETADALENEKLITAEVAVANDRPGTDAETGAELGGDYAYLFLGVQAAETLTTNELILVLDATESKSSIVGILAAVHVAYRVDNGAWVDAEFFSCDWNATKASQNFVFDEKTGNGEEVFTGEDTRFNAYKESIDNAATKAPTAAGAVIIPLNNSLTPGGHISQVELVIYIAGADKDCRNEAAVNVSGKISMFFHTVAPAAQGN